LASGSESLRLGESDGVTEESKGSFSFPPFLRGIEGLFMILFYDPAFQPGKEPLNLKRINPL
jgi:hypothetical protein